MGRILKVLGILVGALVALIVVAILLVVLLVDPNDYRDEIAQQVQEATGRELTIEGELSLSVFPWVAIEVGRTQLGNAEGFGDEPFVRFENATLSVRVLPLIFSQEIAVGTASLDGFEANLAVASNGVSNWADLAEAGEADVDETPSADGGDVALDIANVRLSDAKINYSDAQSGSRYAITGLNVSTGRIAAGETFAIDGGFDFAADPGEMGGTLAINADVTLTSTGSETKISTSSPSALPLRTAARWFAQPAAVSANEMNATIIADVVFNPALRELRTIPMTAGLLETSSIRPRREA